MLTRERQFILHAIYFCFSPFRDHVFISASDRHWHPEMFTDATRRQMRPQKWNACVTWAPLCFRQLSPPLAVQWVTSTNTAFAGLSIPVPVTAHWLTASEFPSLAPDAEETLSARDTAMGMIVSERLLVACPYSNTSLLSGNIYKAITPSPFIQ